MLKTPSAAGISTAPRLRHARPRCLPSAHASGAFGKRVPAPIRALYQVRGANARSKRVDFDCQGQARSMFPLSHVRTMQDHTVCRVHSSLAHSARVFLRQYELCSLRKIQRRADFELEKSRFRLKYDLYSAGRARIFEFLTRYPANRKKRKQSLVICCIFQKNTSLRGKMRRILLHFLQKSNARRARALEATVRATRKHAPKCAQYIPQGDGSSARRGKSERQRK